MAAQPEIMRLGDLADPASFTAPLALGDYSRERLVRCLHTMMLIRKAEEHIGDMVTAGLVVCPCHLCIGQEAVAVGVSEQLRRTDRVFSTHRAHAHYLACEGAVTDLFAEILGKVNGCSRGMGGSMHLFNGSRGFSGSVPIVAGTIPIAVGAALAAKMDGRGDIAVAYFGDGAVEEGAVHESLNLASTLKAPVLFVCENNLYASHLHIGQRQASDATARFAQSHGIRHELVDGNDVVAVAAAAARLAARARAGEGPGYLEAVTYRWRGHVGPRDDIDVGVTRKGDLARWKNRDPIGRLERALVLEGVLDADAVSQTRRNIAQEIESAWAAAMAAPYPESSATLDLVYAPRVQK